MKLNALNMLNVSKAGAPERTKALSAHTSAKESSFKDVLGQSKEKVNSPTKDFSSESAVPEEKVSAESFPGAPSLPSAPVMQPAMQPSPMAMKQTPLTTGKELNTDVDSLTRRVVWNDFLSKMNDELGISADRILEAFSSLSEEELAAPPEENVQKLIMALGLNQQQAPVAHKLFTDLLQKTQTKSIGAELATSTTQINLSLMSQRELQRKQMQQSLEKMNNQFFMAGSEQPKQQAPMTDLAPIQKDESTKLAPELATPFALESKALPTITAPALTPKINEIVNQMEPVTQTEQEQFFETIKKSLSTGKAMPAAPAALLPEVVAPIESNPVPNAEIGMSAAQQAFSQALNSDAQFSEGDKEAQENDELLQPMTAADRNLASIKPEFKLNTSSPLSPEAPQQMGVPDLISQARVMVRNGGGEMKVSLTPDGLGEVAMKVSVDKGLVNVQMITESDEAKKLIERGLSDLKSNLQANNLSLDTIKVDTASSLGRQLEQQHHESQRQNAQSFLENFRQNQQGWRQNFLGTPSAAVARSQVQGSSANPTPYYKGSGKKGPGDRRLDLVA